MITVHKAPWDSKFQTFWFKGNAAYELQIGPVVFQWFYTPTPGRSRWRMWTDPFWRL